MQITKEMYPVLFNAITDAIELIDSGKSKEARAVLTEAQVRAEEAYISNM